MNSIGKLGAMQQLINGGRMMPAAAISDDSVLVKKVLTEHNPEGIEYDVRPLLRIVEDVLICSTLTSEGPTTV